MQRVKVAFGLVATTVLVATLTAQEAAKTEKRPAKESKEVQANFERLKKLVGEWQAVDAKDEVAKGKIVLRYRLTAGGTAVAETIFPDSDTEMLSVYHADGDKLVLTHYCCMGNQPRMRAKPGADKDELIFEFTGGSNLDAAKDGHIHNGKIRFLDADHLKSEWEFYTDGKPAGKHSFDLVRKK